MTRDGVDAMFGSRDTCPIRIVNTILMAEEWQETVIKTKAVIIYFSTGTWNG
jgi:hypothetical protein